MRVEIRLAEDNSDNFEHEGYYGSYDDAIEVLIILNYGDQKIVNKYIDAILHYE